MGKNGNNHYTAAQFIAAMPGSGGIISTIASRVGCHWHTAKKYIDTMPTVKDAYDDECERIIDTAVGVVIGNIQAAVKIQQDAQKKGKPRTVESADAKWYLTRKGKHRGYAERHELAHEGDVVIRVVRE